jgi:hypothetical protein
MNRVALSDSVGVGEESVEVTARGSTTSMGPNGWNPNPMIRGSNFAQKFKVLGITSNRTRA